MLRFNKTNTKCKEGIKFEEELSLNGSWESTDATEADIIKNGHKVKELDYWSDDYTYFLRENKNCGAHTIYRVDK